MQTLFIQTFKKTVHAFPRRLKHGYRCVVAMTGYDK